MKITSLGNFRKARERPQLQKQFLLWHKGKSYKSIKGVNLCSNLFCRVYELLKNEEKNEQATTTNVDLTYCSQWIYLIPYCSVLAI